MANIMMSNSTMANIAVAHTTMAWQLDRQASFCAQSLKSTVADFGQAQRASR